ncbi:PREDICTED: uncharacterized protein LOC104606254 [Nelumbo nucifera]|uniref:Uncharacterized protein LOC104606254 n=2 Tax=Nelumbo nucifera TaxID=4432 RepID=A0A1U8B238_NELNU|nr:PREDICTED: uncharacterized protein LOC104606254 [Nelumbo nucifera]XP_010269655.1 PREDICTED: uncharacterized protein LOC104606254 [Nelumbo nucifera]XP_010269656.1 PREDICTED: uncharacterized protein LOC104606254 [Nelumbo nucifera]XP_010269657.1 PREDICTED: uncharacterized protein LOC104606254 [Nelumbo nucifera]DAD29561.1 TPA_asm: hypothetical protein HUJ06_031029 [Nelumbo nucifera]
MEYSSVEDVHDKNKDGMQNEVVESDDQEMNVEDAPRNLSDVKDVEINMMDTEIEDSVAGNAALGEGDTLGEVNMEASIMPDDVIRAGGFGARDDISSFLPVAIDSTDFEASLRDARDYEEPQGEICRPGLGWKDASETEES